MEQYMDVIEKYRNKSQMKVDREIPGRRTEQWTGVIHSEPLDSI